MICTSAKIWIISTEGNTVLNIRWISLDILVLTFNNWNKTRNWVREQ